MNLKIDITFSDKIYYRSFPENIMQNKHSSTTPKELMLNKLNIYDRISPFGFAEIADIHHFLKSVRPFYPDKNVYRYIRAKIIECLRANDNGSDYFIPLREFLSELSCII